MKQLRMSAILCLIFVLSACNISVPDDNPAPEILITETPTLAISPSPSPSLTASVTPTQEISDVPVIVASQLPTQDNLAPESNITPTPTQGACEATILEGEALIGALLRVPCGNQVTNGLVDAVVAFNDNITNANVVSSGLTFFVPLPSPTPVPEGADMTETAAAERDVTLLGNIQFPDNQVFECYTVVEGDSVVSITDQFNTSLEVMSQLNPNLGWGGCNFTNPSGGPSCSPNLRIGDCVTVPLPTGTPIPTTTPSGNETATPTPTHEPARIISPPNGSVVNQRITLEWVSVGILRSSEIYLIDIEDRTAGTTTSYVTRNTRYTLPDSLIPTDGQAHTIAWQVRIARDNGDTTYSVIGGTGTWYTFQWQSR
ncbi:MAG: LysM domain-containing protein [Phototrophicaceae bacterium]